LDGADVLGWSRVEPEVVPLQEPYPISENLIEIVASKRNSLAREGRPNDAHGIIVNRPMYGADQVSFQVQPLDFAHVAGIRGPEPKRPHPVPLLSANVLIVCPEARVLLLNKRSMHVSTYKGALHTFGGAYAPPYGGRDNDKRSVRWTAMREVFEESNVILTWDEAPVLYVQETKTGFIQVAYLGVSITSTVLHTLEAHWEGTAVRIGFDALHSELLKEERLLEPGEDPTEPHPYWVPTCKASILAWLALAAPTAGGKTRFGSYSSSELFDILVPGA
jgi:hypothetical protein